MGGLHVDEPSPGWRHCDGSRDPSPVYAHGPADRLARAAREKAAAVGRGTCAGKVGGQAERAVAVRGSCQKDLRDGLALARFRSF